MDKSSEIKQRTANCTYPKGDIEKGKAELTTIVKEWIKAAK